MENRKAQARVLSSLTTDAQENILIYLEESPRSFADAAVKVSADHGLEVTPQHLRAWAEQRLLQRRFARALSSSSALASISAAQRAKLKAALKDRSRLRLHDLLSELSPTEASDRSLARIGSMIDSFDRTELAIQANRLAERAQDTREADLQLRTLEQTRKDESLKLEREKFEDMKSRNSKTREALERLEGKGGITPEAKSELIDTLSGVAR